MMKRDTTWYEQHLRTLAALSGLSADRAAALFDRRIHVAIDPGLRENRTFVLLFTTAVSLVARLFPNVSFDPLPESAFAILPWGRNSAPAAAGASEFTLRVGCGGGDVHVSCGGWRVFAGTPHAPDPAEPFNPVLAIVAACYGVAALTSLVLGDAVDGKQSFRPFSILDFESGAANFDWEAPLALPKLHLGGVGAIGSAFLYTLAAHGRGVGDLILIDHDAVDLMNIGRYLYFDLQDVELEKVEAARRKLLVHAPGILPVGVPRQFEHFFDGEVMRDPGFRVEHLISCPDRRQTRRDWQSRFPRHVFDASTGPDEVVLHTNSYAPDRACMECIYPVVVQEQAHAKHVAEKLGVHVNRILSGDAITRQDAAQIVAVYPQLNGRSLEGLAFDSVFRDLCGAGQLTVDDHVVLAPFPFTSALAGAMLYLEVVKYTAEDQFSAFLDANYSRLNPMQQPNPAFRLIRGSRPECRCQTGRFRSAFGAVWRAHAA